MLKCLPAQSHRSNVHVRLHLILLSLSAAHPDPCLLWPLDLSPEATVHFTVALEERKKTSGRRRKSERAVLMLLHSGSLVATIVAAAVLPPNGLDYLLLFFGWVAGGLGISVGYHRMLAHRSFDASPLTELVLLSLGAMTGQGAPRYWAHLHRTHHRYSDKIGDPHSPVNG